MAVAVEARGLRAVARQVGLSPGSVAGFLCGVKPYRGTLEKVTAWYALHCDGRVPPGPNGSGEGLWYQAESTRTGGGSANSAPVAGSATEIPCSAFGRGADAINGGQTSAAGHLRAVLASSDTPEWVRRHVSAAMTALGVDPLESGPRGEP